MHTQTLLSSLPLFLLTPFVSTSPLSSTTTSNLQNANHIFNALHSATRQWGSSLNHNGMSFFMASVPAGTQLYHGTWRNESVRGTEWLAFEPEHAMLFARGRMGGPPGDGRGKGPGGPPLRGFGGDGDVLGGEGSTGKKEGGGHWWEFWRHGGDGEEGERHHDEEEEWKYHGPPHGPDEHEHEHEHLGDWKHHGPPPLPPGGRWPPPPEHGFPPSPPDHHRRPPFPGHLEKPPHHDGRPFPGRRRPPPPPPFPHHEHEREDEHASGPFARPPPPPPFDRHRDRRDDPPHRQNPLRLNPSSNFPPPPHIHNFNTEDEDQRTGYLHTYAPTRALTLLYIDGMSAGKTTNGTLDSQDYLLLNLTEPGRPDDGAGPGGMFREHERAEGLCNMSATLWEGKVDGFLRMEGGFEIILCKFEAALEVVSIMPVVASEGPGRGGVLGGWRYQQAVASRYHGIGGGRVRLDYEHFVTAFAYEGLELFDNDGQSDVPMPRLTKARAGDLRRIREDVTEMVLSSDVERIGDGVDWQGVADMLVQRYSAPLHYLGDEDAAVRKSKDAMTVYLSTLMRPFIDYTARNSSIETERCVAQVLPPVPPPTSPSLAHMVVEAVAERVCSTLIAALDITTASQSASKAPPPEALESIDTLTAYLQWTTWKECGACSDEELCIIPIWPMGTFEDHASPRCKAEGDVTGVNGYWGHWGPPGGRRPPPPPGQGDDRDGGRARGMEV